MVFYLNSVEEGGETTFPVADNRTYEEQVSLLAQPVKNHKILSSSCHCEMVITLHNLNAADTKQKVLISGEETGTACPK